MYGASGGNSIGLPAINNPGLGGRVQTSLSVNPGDILSIYVGGQGLDGDIIPVSGGWNGGGDSGTGYGQYGGGSGGGASDIRLNGNALSDRVIVAGGGGGAGVNTYAGGDNGGNGGDLVADDGVSGAALPTTIGYGGTQVAGGTFGYYTSFMNGTAGVLGIGGNAGSDSGGGGGGGGYYGGGGACWAGGSGGSSFTNPTVTSATTHTKGFNTGNGQITLTPISILPIELDEITALVIDNYIEISWTSYSEINNDYYTLEKSMNGVDGWKSIGIVDGAGNSSVKLNYSIIDKMPINGFNYYRLVQTDYDGVVEYFKPIQVDFSKQINGFVYPNPTKNNFTLTLDDKININEISIFNMLGQNITSIIYIEPLSRNEFSIDLSSLPLGSYFVKVGSQTYKIIKVD